jgi:O-antigen ligase
VVLIELPLAPSRGLAFLRGSGITVLFAATLALGAASVLWSSDLQASWRAVPSGLVSPLIVFLAVAATGPSTADRLRVATALGLSSVALAVTGVSLKLLGVTNPFGGITGPHMDYNTLCMELLAGAPLLFCLAAASSSVRVQSAWTAALAFVLGAVALTHSRIGWLAAMVLVGVLWILVPPERKRLAALCAGALLVVALLWPGSSSLLEITDNEKLLLDSNATLDASVMKPLGWREVLTFNNRLDYAWKPAFELVAQRPWTGWGFGPGTFRRLTSGRQPVLGHEHNALLALAVQSGVPAAALWLACVVAVGVRSVRAARRSPPFTADAVLGACIAAAVVAEFLVQGIGEPVANKYMGTMFAALAGLAVALPL